MKRINGRSFLVFGLIAGVASYAGCSKRDNVARNPGDAGEAGMSADVAASGNAGTLGAGANGAAGEGGSDGSSGAGVGASAAAGDTAIAGDGAGGDANTAGPCGMLSFAPAVPYDIKPSALVSRGLAAGDLNGDEKPDLVVSNTDADASIFLNQGDGTFDDPFTIPVRGQSKSGDPVDVITFDANGDQKLDLAFINYPNAVAISLNKGGAMFETPVDHSIDGALTSVVAGDLTGDGKPDLVVSLQAGGVGVLVNKGNGTFEDIVPYVASGYGWSLAIADFDGQMGQDLVVTTPNGPQGGLISVLLNDGDGTFGAEHPNGDPMGNPYCYVTAAQLGGDSRPDLVLSCGTVSVLFNMSTITGSFMPHEAWKQLMLGNTDPGRIVTVDLLGRGRRDIVTGGGSPLNVYLNQGDDTFSEPQPFSFLASTTSGSAVVSADFNDDGKPDLAVVTNSSTDGLSVLINTCTP